MGKREQSRGSKVRSAALGLAIAAAPAMALGGGGCSNSKGESGAPSGNVQAGKASYDAMCASCHGTMGQGGLGPRLNPWKKTQPELVDIIDATMPKGDPSQCTGQCAEDVAAYIMSWSDSAVAGVPARRLRLLTRREYNNTVRDLLHLDGQTPSGGMSGGACQTDADCDVAHASCVGGTCAADPCSLHTFVFPAGGKQYGAVTVAGSFNSWSASAGADWQMKYLAAKDLYVLKHSLSDGIYPYKFVLDGKTWITDPSNPLGQDDGFGGKNSLLTMSCAGGGGGMMSGGAGLNAAKDFPVETRPPGYGFDNNVDAGLVTSVHVDQYMKAAASLAALAQQDLSAIVPCDPAKDAKGCAETFARTFGERAFRRPLADDEVTKYAGIVTGQKDFTAGVGVAIQVMLSSPYFLYRFEVGAPLPDGTFKLTPYETASALSYLFWGTLPDQALFDAAKGGDLGSADGIEKQARRLLADPRSRPVIETFAAQWLGVEGVLLADKNATAFPGFDDATKEAMLEETQRFVSYVVFDGSRKYEELLTADYTFANDTLASLYGISGVSGSALQKVASAPERKAGLLGQGSVLATYAKSDQSSPIHRGLFVRRRLLCEELPPPPPKVPALPPVDPNSTTRERFAQHSGDPVCHSCHQYIDGVGFGFESFDAIGRHRQTENGKPIDASGDMNDIEQLGSGTSAPFASLPELSGILAQSRRAKECFATQVYRFTEGAIESPADIDALTAIEGRFQESGDDIQELLVAVTKTQSFTLRK